MVYLPNEIVNKIVMINRPIYPYITELETTRFVRYGCECEGCTQKHRYGCYEFEFNDSKYGKKQLRCKTILAFNNII
jgi:hypothetical protein